MREIKPGDNVSSTEYGEVFKYVVSSEVQYTLISLPSSNDRCHGCVFRAGSNHPLSGQTCSGNSIRCDYRIFKSVDDVMEGL